MGGLAAEHKKSRKPQAQTSRLAHPTTRSLRHRSDDHFSRRLRSPANTKAKFTPRWHGAELLELYHLAYITVHLLRSDYLQYIILTFASNMRYTVMKDVGAHG